MFKSKLGGALLALNIVFVVVTFGHALSHYCTKTNSESECVANSTLAGFTWPIWWSLIHEETTKG